MAYTVGTGITFGEYSGTTSHDETVSVANNGSLVLVLISSATSGDNHGTPTLGGVNMTQVGSNINGTQRSGSLWYAENVSAGNKTLHIAPSSIGNRWSAGYVVIEGAKASGAFDTSNTGGTATGTSRTGSVTPSVANALTIMINFNLYNAGTNSTKSFGTGDDHNLFYNTDDKAASSFSMTATYTSSQQNDYIIAAFKPAATDVTCTPSVLAASFSIPAPTETGTANVTPAVQSAVFSSPARTVSGGATTTPNALSAVFSLPTVNIITPDAQILATVLTATFSLPTATPSGGASVDATVQSATFSIPTVSFIGSVTISPDAQVATFSTPAPTISAIGNVTVSASTVAATFSLQSPTVTAEQNAMFNAGVLSATFSIPTPTITATQNITVSASVISATFSIPTPLRKVGGLWTAQPRAQGVWTPQPRAI